MMGPIVKLEIESMRESIAYAFAQHQIDISKEVQSQLDLTLKNFNFEEAIRDAARQVIYDTITKYFKYGEGYKLIEKLVNEAFDGIVGKIR